jgi:hypothetical protein
MSDTLEAISQQLKDETGRNFDTPPLHLWHPALSGDIAIRIATDGTWSHQGDPIKRESLRNLFASILRREDDGEYYLVTPPEKWRIKVDLHPLLVTDAEMRDDTLLLTLNTGKTLTVDEDHALFLEPRVDNVAAVKLWHGLTALFSRSAWYRLVELSTENGLVRSGSFQLQLR